MSKKTNMESKSILQKMLIGHFIEKIPKNCNKRVVYVWQGNGIWEIRSLSIGTFYTHVHKFEVPGLNNTYKEGWTLNVPKIPATLLDVTLSFFREIYERHSSEVFLQYFYDTKKKEYSLHCPQQTVGPGSVNYKRDIDYEKGKILVFEIHSHGNMGAFFSGIDDADEKDDRFFGVIGKVKQYYPELKIRLSVGGKRQEIDIEDIFDLDKGSYYKESFPSEWINCIKEKKVKIVERTRSRNRKRNRSGGIYYPLTDTEYNDITYDDLYLDDKSSIFIDDIEYKQYIKNIKDQKIIEKNNKTYIVTDTGTEEIWEEVEPTKQEVNNGKSEYYIEQSDDSKIVENWRDIKW